MKQLLLILSFLSFTSFVSAQSWAPTGAKWTFGIGWAFTPYVEYCEWVSTGDTLVEGRLCKLIKRNCGEVVGDISDKLITYEDSNIVYWYNMNQFTVLYDFNKNTGESWITMFDTCSLLVTVDSTGFDTINGFILKALYVSSDNWAFNGKILEHIGHLGHPNPNVDLHCYGIIADVNFYNGLRCYEDSILGFHSFGIAPSCEHTTTGIDQVESPFGFLVFPNPTTDKLNIQSKLNQQFHFSIYNSVGQLIQQGITESNETTIYLNNLPNGLYSIALSAKNETERKCFIVEK